MVAKFTGLRRKESLIAEDCFHGRNQIPRGARFYHESSRARFLNAFREVLGLVHCKDQDFRSKPLLVKFPYHVEPALSWHADVEYHKVRLQRLNFFQSVGAISGLSHHLPTVDRLLE